MDRERDTDWTPISAKEGVALRQGLVCLGAGASSSGNGGASFALWYDAAPCLRLKYTGNREEWYARREIRLQ